MSLLVATVVPFDRRADVDVGALRAHCMTLLGNGAGGLAPMLDEFLWLEPSEKDTVIKVTCDVGAGKTVLPCIWAPNPGELVRLAKVAEGAGAVGVIVPPPLLHALPAGAILSWYRNVAMSVHIPVFAWMHPTFGNDLPPALLMELQGDVGLGGFIDSFGDPFRIRRLARDFPGRAWAGDDALASDVRGTPGLAGWVSLASNVWPEMAGRLWRGGPLGEAWKLRTAQLQKAGGVSAVKRLLRMGTRPPFTEIEQAAFERL